MKPGAYLMNPKMEWNRQDYLDPGPDLSNLSYTDENGNILHTYKDIRNHQVAVIKAWVEHKINEGFKGCVDTVDTAYAMKHEAIGLLRDQQARGKIHPHASVERWIDCRDMHGYAVKKLHWTNWANAQGPDADLWPWLPRHESWCDCHKCGRKWEKHLRWNGHIWVPDKRQQLKDKIRQQLAPNLLNHNGLTARTTRVNFRDVNQNEIAALQLLRQMVSGDIFKRYLKSGFVTVTAGSGLTYQITRNSHMIKVWDKGQHIADLCVYTQGIPPTDDVIARMLICECDEPDIWRRANVKRLDNPSGFDIAVRTGLIQQVA
jgi:hypothetical protein